MFASKKTLSKIVVLFYMLSVLGTTYLTTVGPLLSARLLPSRPCSLQMTRSRHTQAITPRRQNKPLKLDRDGQEEDHVWIADTIVLIQTEVLASGATDTNRLAQPR